MNTIYFSERHELTKGKFVIPFSCSDIKGINTECRPHERTDIENKVLGSAADRITLVLQKHGYSVELVNFRNMAITAVQTEVL